MTTRRSFLQASGGVALGLGGITVLTPATAHADATTERIQRNLNGIGYNAGTVTGTLNAATTAAVKRFQVDNRLTADGNPGAITQSVLAARVSLVQHKAGTAHDSSFGSGTAAAVKKFQTSRGLVADGIAGAATHSAMGIVRAVGLGTSGIGGNVRRTEIIQRAAYWPTIGLGYSRSKWYRDINNSKTYRQDCSGLVSNAFHATTSYATYTLDQVTSSITQASLLPGDIVNKPHDHTVVFCGWVPGSNRTKYYALEESGSYGAIARINPFPFYGGSTGWTNRRYHKAIWG